MGYRLNPSDIAIALSCLLRVVIALFSPGFCVWSELRNPQDKVSCPASVHYQRIRVSSSDRTMLPVSVDAVDFRTPIDRELP